ncbi:MAG TPA: aspartate-semialdehyde dehydrogenase [Actinomycetota bacterium]|nr:aspartate-semialdehyde dehydrogenase [Actinomycetota bacterium]
MRIVLVGATGAVGSEILEILETRRFPIDELVPVASERSAGRALQFDGSAVTVVALNTDVFEAGDLALFDVPDEVALEWAPLAVEAGATVVDNSAAWRMNEQVPLVVPEINPDAVRDRPIGIVASPNCTTLAMVVPLAALHARAGLTRLVVASYQAASGAGRAGVDELWEQTQRVAKDEDTVVAGRARDLLEPGSTFPQPLAMNVVPLAGSIKRDGYTSEELKLCFETRKILDLPDLPVTATCVRVPVVTGHSVAVHAEFERELSADEAREILAEAPGVELRDDPERGIVPTPLEAAGRDPCYVGRIRADLFNPRALELFCVADNLRKGAALNTVQVAELIASN